VSKTLARAELDAIASGLMPGIPEDKVPLWADARNVIFDKYGARPAPGYGPISLDVGLFDAQSGNFDDATGDFDSASTSVSLTPVVGSEVRGLAAQQLSDGRRVFFYGTLSNLYRNDGTEAVVSKPGGYTGFEDAVIGQLATFWSFAEWGDWTLATNGVEAPQILKPPMNFNDLAGVQCAWARIVFTLGQHAILANTSNGQNAIEWSAIGNPEIWNPATDVTAGRRIIRSFPGPILAAAPIGAAYLLFGDTQAHLMQPGGQFMFATVPGPQGIGAVSQNSVVSIGQRVYGIMRDGIFECDGVNFRWVTYPQFGRWLVDNVNWAQASKICGWHDAQWQNIRWAVPLGGNTRNSLVIVYNYTNNIFSFETSVFSVGIARGRLAEPLIGTSDGRVLAAKATAAAPGRWAETKAITVGQRDVHAFLDTLSVIKIGTEFRVRIAYSSRLGGPFTWITLGNTSSPENIFYPMREAMYVKVRVECEDPNANWQIAGLELTGHLTGGRR
jgi:hypothetical protein